MQHCVNCGKQFLADVVVCPNCGAVNPYYKPGQRASQPADEPPTIPFGAFRETSSVPSDPSSLKAPRDAKDLGAFPPANGPDQPFARPLLFNNPGPPSPPPSVKTRSGLSRSAMISLFVLTILLMSSGVGLIFYTSVLRPSQLRVQATATMRTFLNAAARATATANVQATSTSIAQTRATATAQVQARAQIQATATALQDVYNNATSGTPVLDSSLAYPTNVNWDLFDTQDGGGCTFAGGAFHSRVLSTNHYVPCFARSTNFSNFALEMQVDIIKGDEGGITFRGDDKKSTFYMFSILADGHYSLYSHQDDTHSTPLAYEKNAAVHTMPGQPNTLTIVARGSILFLYINKQFVANVNDSSYSSGQIGVFAVDSTRATDVAFSNLRVWNL